MALFTDGNISAPDDLAAIDSGVLSVANTEAVDLSRKIALAQENLAIELALLLPPEDSLNNIVVTSALRLWHSYHTLELVYRDAYNSQLNDRYAGRRDQFAALAKHALDKLVQLGLGMSGDPVPKAAQALLTYVAGQQAGATYYVCTSWLNAGGGSGAAGDYVSIAVPDNNILSVRPGGAAPPNAAGWNVFVGLTPDTLAQQNQSPLALGQPWLQQAAVSTAGAPPSTGQGADFTRTVARVLQRG